MREPNLGRLSSKSGVETPNSGSMSGPNWPSPAADHIHAVQFSSQVAIRYFSPVAAIFYVLDLSEHL